MIIGTGIDLVDIPRFERTVERTPRLLERLFTPSEQPRRLRSLAARYAAKEALIKALGGSDGVHWTEIEIASEDIRAPSLRAQRDAPPRSSPSAASHACTSRSRHDAGLAAAFVVGRGRAAVTAPFREATVELDAIADNARHFKRLTGAEVIAVVKADAYGHGAAAAAVAALAGGATRLGVAEIAEALALRRQGVRRAGARLAARAGGAIRSRRPPRASRSASRRSTSSRPPRPQPIRRPSRRRAPEVRDRSVAQRHRPRGLGGACSPRPHDSSASAGCAIVGLFSHLSNTSPEDDRAALARFEEGVRAAASFGIRPEIRHLAATAAAIDHPEMRLDAVRIGIGLYGLSPFADRSSGSAGPASRR